MTSVGLRISKSVMAGLPPWLERTMAGLPKGAVAQYRGPGGLHVREYPDSYEVHVDLVDPRIHPALHLLLDNVSIAAIPLALALAGKVF